MQLPFDGRKLDALMDASGIDLLLATDKDSVQYLTGGYRFFFLAHKDAIGISRYLPALGYPKGSPEKAFYVGHGLEPQHQAVEPLWVPNISNTQKSSEHAARLAAERIGSSVSTAQRSASRCASFPPTLILRSARSCRTPNSSMSCP
jgi:hypothetical protein